MSGPHPVSGPVPTAAVAGSIRVTATDDRADPTAPGACRVDVGRWATLAEAVLAAEGGRGEMGLVFVDSDEMAALNLEHMGHRGPTDVLAFPLDAGDAGDVSVVAGCRTDHVPRLVGDVVICPQIAAGNAAEHAGPVHDGSSDAELALLVVHGVLHLLGWDHAGDADRRRMQARERRHLEHWWQARR